MTQFLLIRHGQNDLVNQRRIAGWTPGVHLNQEGRAQASDLAERLNQLSIKAVYSSPLERCMETAEIVARRHGIAVTPFDDVGEVRFGEWEGSALDDLIKKKSEWFAVQHFPSRFRFPQGESFIEVQHRAVRALELIAGQHEKDMVAVVSHADVIKLILAHYLGVHIDLFQRIMISPASVSVVALTGKGSARIMRVNDNGRLRPLEELSKDKSKE